MTASYEELTKDQRMKRAGLVGGSYLMTHSKLIELVTQLCENSYTQGYNDAFRITRGQTPIDLEWAVSRPEASDYVPPSPIELV